MSEQTTPAPPEEKKPTAPLHAEETGIASPPAPAVERAASSDQSAPSRMAPKRKILVVLGVLVGMFAVFKFTQFLAEAFSTVSTDDAYVNSHATYVAARVQGQVAKVLVDDNNRVRKGDVLVELDKEPYEVQVNLKKAALAAAQADLVAARASVNGLIGQARSSRFKLDHAIEDVDNQVAVIRANVALLNRAKATLTLAQEEFERAKKLIETKVTSHEEFDQRQEALDVAQAQYNQALETVYQSRLSLGLPAKPANSDDLTETPPDLDQTYSAVREAQAQLMQSAAQLGVTISSYDLKPKEMIAEFYRRDPGGNIDRIYAELVKTAPPIQQAEAKIKTAESDLAQAELNLKYCTVVSEIDGVVTRRDVNPGNNVQVGQSLMVVRSLSEIWVDANFKETQLADLRIGQPVDLETDTYGRKDRFKGRISGFTMGTGSTLALLPAQNATGNFVKVVQRLPVRIDLVDYDPEKRPLFVGISVTPKVHIKQTPTGPAAGAFLQPYITPAAAATPGTDASPAQP